MGDIKAKKISQLQNLNIETEKQRYLDSYFVIAYNNGVDDKANYKVRVGDFLESAESGIDESVLDNYATSAYVDNNYMSKNSWQNYYTYIMNTIADNMCDCDQNQGKFNEIWEAIQDIKDLIKYYHNKANIIIDESIHCSIVDNPGFITIDTGSETLRIIPDRGYQLQNDDIYVTGCDFQITMNSDGTAKLKLSNASGTDVVIRCECIAKTWNIIYSNIDPNISLIVRPAIIQTDGTVNITFTYNPEDYEVLPEKIITTNARRGIIDNNVETGICTVPVTANGTGNISITIKLESRIFYYFGFVDSERLFDIAYTDNNESYPVGLQSVEGLKKSNNTLPWTNDEIFTAVDAGLNPYRYIIVPKIMFSISDASLIDPETEELYAIKGTTSDYEISINNPYLYPEYNDGDIFDIGIYDKIEYYAIQIQESAAPYKISKK